MCTMIDRNEEQTLKTARSETVCSPKNLSTKTMLCRICFDTETNLDHLIRPCACSGTVAFVHNSCLERWVRATSNIQCTICQSEFELIPAGLKEWKDISFPKPLSDLPEDYMEFGCTIAWVIYMFRFAYVGLRHGSSTMVEHVDAAIGTGTLRSLWWLSFWFNFLYYGAMCFIFYEKWLIDNTVFQFKDKSTEQHLKSTGKTSTTKSRNMKFLN
ncbi:hypothetical protein B9Z55_005721 [Caenorhabditis nigoni]|nr:hypothetical protein B9Z55_005721 [Caenorhabditis nigoni]